jgi:hypothetical protein
MTRLRMCLVVAVALSGMASTPAPVFVPIKIDGPEHDPPRGSFWFGPFSEGSAVFDVNGDGILDITCGAHWYEGPHWVKHERFRQHATPIGEYINNNGEHPIDVNRNGRLDLISAGWMADGIFWYENPGTSEVPWKATKIVSSVSTEGFIVEDIDGDGDLDVLINHWAHEEGQGVTWLELLDGPEFAVHVIGTEGNEHGCGLGDINGDGRLDIITPRGWYEAPVNRSTEDWVFHADYSLPEGVSASIRMPVIDVNGDGLNDIIVGNGHGYGLFWLEQRVAEDGTRTFEQHVIDDSIGQVHTVILADVNQNGKLDLVTGKRLRGHAGADPSAFDPLFVFWYEINGGEFKRHVLSYNHLFWYPGMQNRNPPPNYAIGAGMSIHVVDVNQNGLVDIVVAGKSGLYLFENRGAPPTKPMVEAK